MLFDNNEYNSILQNLKSTNFQLYTFFLDKPKLLHEYVLEKVPLTRAIQAAKSYFLIPISIDNNTTFFILLHSPFPEYKTNSNEFANVLDTILQEAYQDNRKPEEIILLTDAGNQVSLSFGFNPDIVFMIRNAVKEHNIKVLFRLRNNGVAKSIINILASYHLPKNSNLGSVKTLREGLQKIYTNIYAKSE